MKDMKYIILVLISIVAKPSIAQFNLTISQNNGFTKTTILGHEDAIVNQVTNTYTFKLDEPEYLAIFTDSPYKHLYRLWVDPRSKSRIATIDYKNQLLSCNDTLPIEFDTKLCDPYYEAMEQSNSEAEETQARKSWSLCMTEYITSNPDSFLAVYYLNMCLSSISIDQIRMYRSKVNPLYFLTHECKEIDEHIATHLLRGNPKLGDTLIDVTLNQANDKPFSTKSIKSKATLLYFWSSRCGPCTRMSLPLKSFYKKYHTQGLEIISYAHDDSAIWHKTSLERNYPWINLSDPAGDYGLLPLHYHVDRFPYFVLFDKYQKISLITFGNELPLLEEHVQKLLNQ
jgi:peroxiredoxin